MQRNQIMRVSLRTNWCHFIGKKPTQHCGAFVKEPTHKTKHNGFIVKKPTLHEGLILNIKNLTVFIPNEQIQNERFIAMKTTQQDRFKV